ncbi:MAG: sulfotransferase [Polyangia bacterium]
MSGGSSGPELISRRLFVVGCSRSGTTMLQVALASHPRVCSFPETFFFRRLTKGISRLPARLGLPTGRRRAAFERLLAEIERPDLEQMAPRRVVPVASSAAAFTAILDRVALEQGCDIWLEKTPMHLLDIAVIRRHVPAVRFVHVIRDGRDVVASIHDRARRLPELFPRQQEISFGIERWNRSLRISQRHFGRPGHSFAVYEDLVDDPERTLRRLCREIGIDYREEMLSEREQTARSVIPEHRSWIGNAAEPPGRRPSKFRRLFDAGLRDEITAALELDRYERLRERIESNPR